MKPYLLSLGAGLLVGVVYSLLGVRSPAPPVIALVGLLGILVGEQLPPFVKRLIGNGSAATTVAASRHHVFGRLPGHRDAPAAGGPPRPEAGTRSGTPA